MNFERPHNTEPSPETPEAKLEKLESQIAEMEQRLQAIEAENYRLKHKNEQLEGIALQDSLTEIFNRRGLYSYFEKFVRTSERDKTPPDYSVVFVDLKGLKAINDTQGHDAGDTLLKDMATNVKLHLRPADLYARWGGDEFVLVLPHTNESDAHTLTERIAKNLPDGIYFRSGIASSEDIERSYGRKPTLDEVITIADELTNVARGSETRMDFKPQSNILSLSEKNKMG